MLDLKLPEKTGCRQPGSSVTALTKSALSGAAVLWGSRYGDDVSIGLNSFAVCQSTNNSPPTQHCQLPSRVGDLHCPSF